MAIPKNGKKKKSLLKSSKEVKTAQTQNELLRGLQLDLQETEAEMEQLHGGSSSCHLDEIDRLKKAISKIKKLAG